MEKFIEALANLEKSFSRFEELSDNYINNLSVLAERRREAQSEVERRALKKAQDLLFLKELSVKVDRIYRKMKKMGLLEEVRTH